MAERESRLIEFAESWERRKVCAEMPSDAEFANDVSQRAHKLLGYKKTSRLVHLKKELN